MFYPTTKVDVFRDSDSTDTDVYGDETETGSAPVAVGVPASVVEDAISRRSPVDLSGERVTTYTIRVASRSGIREGDRLRDQRTRLFYVVKTCSTPQQLVGGSSSRLVCTRVGST